MAGLREDGRSARVVVMATLAVVAAIGVGGERWASAGDEALAEPGPPSVVVPLEPARILDTRTGVGAPAGRVASGQTLTLQVTGVGGVPAGATGVLLNLTATVADGAGYVSAYPAGGARPDASVINYSGGEDVANMVTAQLSADGAIDVFNAQANVHLLADVAGYLVPGSGAVGAQGPQGPAGPGATLIDVEFPQGPVLTVATVGGIALQLSCSGGGPETLTIRTTPATSDLRIGGIRTVDDVIGGADVYGGTTSWTVLGNGAIHFSGFVENLAVGDTYQVDLHLSETNPCRGWGSTIPLG